MQCLQRRRRHDLRSGERPMIAGIAGAFTIFCLLAMLAIRVSESEDQ